MTAKDLAHCSNKGNAGTYYQRASAEHLNRGEARIIPPTNLPLVHKPLQLSLAHDCMHKGEAGEVPQVHVGQLRAHLLSSTSNVSPALKRSAMRGVVVNRPLLRLSSTSGCLQKLGSREK